MNNKDKKGKPGERINQFIIECMFNKYFEEEEENKRIVVEKEKVLVWGFKVKWNKQLPT